ncbi:MAG: acetyl-CoA carboxylase biotin carboxyl carrier protein [Suipraeoptans sp.]
MKFENLIELISAVSDSTLTDFTYEENEVKITLSKKQQANIQTSLAPSTADIQVHIPESQIKSEVAEFDGKVINSPLVGTFYIAPGEGEPAFVKAGDSVITGQTLAIVEAMKLMNEIESDFDGVIEEVLVSNGEMVEYGQPLFRLK